MYLLDASALLALVLKEKGGDVVETIFKGGASISSVNLLETALKLRQRGATLPEVTRFTATVNLLTIPFTEVESHSVLGLSLAKTGLSLADQICLGTAVIHGATVVTADRAWADLKLPVKVKLIR